MGGISGMRVCPPCHVCHVCHLCSPFKVLATIVFTVSILLVGTNSSLAQSSVEEYRPLVDSLQEVWEDAKSTFDKFVAAERARALDTIYVGTLTVITPTEFSDSVKQGAVLAWDSISTIGSDTLLLVGRVLYVPEPANRWSRVSRNLSPEGTVATRIPRLNESVQDVSAAIRGAIGSVLIGAAHASIRSWVGHVFRLQKLGREELSWAYNDLVTAPSFLVRGCYLGDLSDCRVAFGLTHVGDPAFAWYKEHERRVVVNRSGRSLVPGMDEVRYRCVQEQDDSACVEFLRGAFDGDVPPPFGSAARSTLLGVAIETGGDGAITRMVETDFYDRAAWLSDISGLPIDTLIAEWRSSVLEAQPIPATLTGKSAVVAVVWVILFAALAAGSKRWRLD